MAGTTHRFEYTVGEGEEDNDGLEVTANTLATPTGSTIVTTSASGTVLLTHDAVFDGTRVGSMAPARLQAGPGARARASTSSGASRLTLIPCPRVRAGSR